VISILFFFRLRFGKGLNPAGKGGDGGGEMEHPVMFQGVAKDSPAFRLMTQMVRSFVLDFRLPVCCFLCRKL